MELHSTMTHDRLNGTKNNVGVSRATSMEEILREITDSVRIQLRDFSAANMKPRIAAGFRQQAEQPANLAPVLERINFSINTLENLFEQLGTVGPMAAGARAMILNIKLPLKHFVLEMAEISDPSSLSRNDTHSVVQSCLALEHEMSARLIEMDLAALQQEGRRTPGPRAA